jgi:imidazolonepropionase-like amidohydrolase
MDVDGIFENKNVHVKNGRIIKIEVSTHDNRAKLSRIVRTIDGANKYLVPAFFDAHTHLGYKTSEEDSRIPNLWLRLFELV